MARLGVIAPTHLVQRLFGTATRSFHVLPLAMFTLQTLFVYLACRRLSGRTAGVLAASFMSLSTAMNRTASQLLPDGMAGAAVAIAGYCLVRFHEAEGPVRRRWLVGMALSCCWAYAMKESCALLLPGAGLAVLLSRRNFKEALLFAALMAGYGALETLGFRLFTDYPHRLAVVQVKHGYYPPTTFFGLLDRFRKLEPAGQVLFWTWLTGALYHVGHPDKRRRLLLILPVGFIFFLTFLVRRIDPLTVWQSAKPRYMAPVMGVMVVGAAVFVAESLSRTLAQVHWRPLEGLRRAVARAPGPLTFCWCAMLGLIVYRSEREHLAEHPLVTQPRMARILNDAFRRNLPIIEDARNVRGLNTTYGVFLQPKYLVQSDVAHDGRLPNIQEGVRFTRIGNKKKHAYILRDATKYRGPELTDLVRSGCAVVVKAPGALKLNVDDKLPERCRAPRGKVIPR